jgi:hypothetical protein
VETQVQALLAAAPSYHSLTEEQQQQLRRDLVKIGSYNAALFQETCAQSEKLRQVPVQRQQMTMEAPVKPQSARRPLARAAAEQAPTPSDEFSPRAAREVARITRETLNAVSFPTFVADLIKGTFQAIVNASIEQMQAFATLVANVAKTVDQFMADNISDNMARDYLVGQYPGHFRIEVENEQPRIRARDRSDDLPKPDFQSQFGLPEDVDASEETAEEVLVPAARRLLAGQRQSLLSTMVLMGMNRIVVTSGRIQAKMGFRIDAKDSGRSASATDFDWKNETTVDYDGGLFGAIFGGPTFHTKNTVAYVSSTKKDSSDEIDVHTDLSGEVELRFKTDYLPLERLAKPEMIATIQGRTPNPAGNPPAGGTTAKESPAQTESGRQA